MNKELDWSLPENEIESPQFSPDGNFIVLVTRVHWPDGYEAESLPDSFFTKLIKRKQQDPRFADPVIRMIDRKGTLLCEIRYGNSPTVSEDNKVIVFSRQIKPLTGLRPMAETLVGNDIETFDCESKQTNILAQPRSGYFDSPFFLPNGDSIAYTANEAVNGAMGGSVGLEQVDFSGNNKRLLLRQSVPAVPCPSAANAMNDLQRMRCSEASLPSTFPVVVIDSVLAGNQLLALRAKPVPSAGDIYLASHYALELTLLTPVRDQVTLTPTADMNKLWEMSMQATSETTVRIFLGYWRSFSLRTKDWMLDPAPQNKNRHSIYSPDGRFYLAMEPPKDGTHFALYRTADGRKLFTSQAEQTLLSMSWSRDSTRFATVVVADGTSQMEYREVLRVYAIQ